MVARGGFEPPSTDPESAVLPLDDRVYERFNAAIAGRPDLMGDRITIIRHDGLVLAESTVDPETMEATEPFFELVVELTDDSPFEFLNNGAVCEIRFQREYEPLGNLIYRSFLRFSNSIQWK